MTAGANARPGPATLLSLSDVELVMTLGFLDSSTLARCQLTCRTLGAAATNGELTASLSLLADEYHRPPYFCGHNKLFQSRQDHNLSLMLCSLLHG